RRGIASRSANNGREAASPPVRGKRPTRASFLKPAPTLGECRPTRSGDNVVRPSARFTDCHSGAPQRGETGTHAHRLVKVVSTAGSDLLASVFIGSGFLRSARAPE